MTTATDNTDITAIIGCAHDIGRSDMDGGWLINIGADWSTAKMGDRVMVRNMRSDDMEIIGIAELLNDPKTNIVAVRYLSGCRA